MMKIQLNRKRVEERLTELGIKKGALCFALEISPQSLYYRWQHGWPRLEAEYIARLLGVKLGDLT